MTELEDLAKRICDVLDDGCNLLAGSAMHSMLKAALAVNLTAGQRAAAQGYSNVGLDPSRDECPVRMRRAFLCSPGYNSLSCVLLDRPSRLHCSLRRDGT